MPKERHADLKIFYSIVDRIRDRVDATRKLANCNGRMYWPNRGIYFFFEDGEKRTDSGTGNRVVRVGTHALKQGSKSTLWNRLSQHRGVQRTGGGNHRGSVFRLNVGAAILHRDPALSIPSWGEGSNAPSDVKRKEQHLEVMVSKIICGMPFLWLAIDDPAGPDSERGYIERNAIALLSNFQRPALDSPTPTWLGIHCASERVRDSGIWNSNHVAEGYDDAFLDRFDQLVSESSGS